MLLTGIHMMQTGQVEANLVHLNEIFTLPYLPDLIARKLAGPENSVLDEADVAFHQQEFERLTLMLEDQMQASQLPEAPTSWNAVNDLLVRIRLAERTKPNNLFFPGN